MVALTTVAVFLAVLGAARLAISAFKAARQPAAQPAPQPITEIR